MSRRTIVLAVLGGLLAVAVGLVTALARETRALADRYEELRRLATGPTRACTCPHTRP